MNPEDFEALRATAPIAANNDEWAPVVAAMLATIIATDETDSEFSREEIVNTLESLLATAPDMTIVHGYMSILDMQAEN